MHNMHFTKKAIYW